VADDRPHSNGDNGRAGSNGNGDDRAGSEKPPDDRAGSK